MRKGRLAKVVYVGTCIDVNGKRYYVNSSGVIHPITSDRIFRSWGFPRVISTQESAVKGYKIGKELTFRDGTLIKSVRGDKYIVSGRKKRAIVNPDRLSELPGNFVVASNKEIDALTTGPEVE